MSTPGEDLVEAARSHIDAPFRHHFKPENLCKYGAVTVASCMEVGMSDQGFDCSGLVVASVCEVLAINTSDWPITYRHLLQLKLLEENVDPSIGDVQLFCEPNSTRTHMGIYVVENTVVHASGISGLVEEGAVQGYTVPTGVILVERMLSIPTTAF